MEAALRASKQEAESLRRETEGQVSATEASRLRKRAEEAQASLAAALKEKWVGSWGGGRRRGGDGWRRVPSEVIPPLFGLVEATVDVRIPIGPWAKGSSSVVYASGHGSQAGSDGMSPLVLRSLGLCVGVFVLSDPFYSPSWFCSGCGVSGWDGVVGFDEGMGGERGGAKCFVCTIPRELRRGAWASPGG